MTRQVQPPIAVGFYGQLYNEIVRPNQIWRSSRYFVRRWGPILEPSRFWAVIGARHLSYLSEEQNGNFKAWDNEIAGEANLSNSHYRRLKTEMGESSSPLSLFLKKGSFSYINARNSGGDGRVRKGRTRYNVRLDDPLTPADARQVEAELRAAGLNRSTKPEEIVEILKRCRMLEQTRFFAAEHELTSTTYGSWQAVYVTDIVAAVTHKKMADHPAIVEQAEALHSYLTGGDFIGRRYFRDNWLPVIGAGPAWLLTWLRSYCFLDETTGEIRNELSFSKIELAEKLGIHKNALNRWLKLLEQIPDQPFNFVKELSRAKQPDNSVLVTFGVGMFEPLTVVDLEKLGDKYEVESGQWPVISDQFVEPVQSPIQDERYKMNGALPPAHTDERYKPEVTPEIVGGANQNERYADPVASDPTHMNERTVPPTPQFERSNETHLNGTAHPFERNEDSAELQHPQMNGAAPLDERGNEPKRDHLYKHLKNLTNSYEGEYELNESDFALLDAAVVDFGSDSNHLSAVQVLYGCSADFLRTIGADAGASLTVQVLQMGVPLTTLAAWWLYALAEPGIKRPVPFVLKRASGGHVAPETFVKLAKLGLDEWLTHAFALELGLRNELPSFGLWDGVYGDYSLEAVPLVGGLVAAVLDRVDARQADEAGKQKPVNGEQAPNTAAGSAIWAKVLERLAGDVSEMELEIFLKPAVLMFGSDGWTLYAADGSAEAYLKMVLQSKILNALHEVGVSGGLQVVSGKHQAKSEAPPAAEPTSDLSRSTPHASVDDLWQTVLGELQLALPGPAFSTWLKDSALVVGDGGHYLIEVRDERAKDWVQNRFFHLIVQTMAGMLGSREFDLSVVSR